MRKDCRVLCWLCFTRLLHLSYVNNKETNVVCLFVFLTSFAFLSSTHALTCLLTFPSDCLPCATMTQDCASFRSNQTGHPLVEGELTAAEQGCDEKLRTI